MRSEEAAGSWLRLDRVLGQPRSSRAADAVAPTTSAPPAGAPPIDARAVVQLAAISFITLFAEIAFIRWLSAETRIFGFYKNMALISCFLGLGAGATLGKKSTSGRWFVPALAAFALLVMLAAPRFALLRQGSGDEFLWMRMTVTGMDTLRFYVALVLLFALNTGVFYAGGQAVGEAFEGLPPLPGYAANLGGSFLGTVAFTLVSYLQLGPFWWFAIACAIGIVVMWHQRATRWPSIAMTAVTLVFLGLYADPALWSPYYKITLQPYHAPDGSPWGVRIRTNATYHLQAIDLSEKFAQAHPGVKESIAWAHYNLPYRFVKPKRVLVLGAGAGNDVAAALRNGATAVTAVEIDPTIASLGRRLHPEKPYEAPEVKVVVDDARNFLTKADRSYDLIVFGLLDSHTVVAAMSNVRLDSFMYTRESFARAKELLAPDGMLALSFSSGFGESWWLLRRMAYMLERTFGTPPVILDVGYDGGFVFLAGPHAPRELTDPIDRARAESAQRQFELNVGGAAREEATDDWPFMYLRGRWIPIEYWILSAVVLVLALAMVWRLVPGGLGAVDGHFFCLGAGFLLVEVRNLAELSLLFGSTWMVNAFVIAGVLVMAFAANVVAGRVRVPVNAAFIALAVAVALSFFSPVKYLAGMDPWVRTIVGTGILSLPFFFSGLIFSTSFKVAASPAVAYGSNLLGAVAGGLLEHGSLSHGIRSLSLLALVIYALAFLLLQRRKAQETAAAAVAA